jgi:hypothetical protein
MPLSREGSRQARVIKGKPSIEREVSVRRFVLTAAAVMAIGASAASSAVAARNPAGTGEPGTATTSGASCGSTTPVNATMQPNGFSSGGFANAQGVYANPGTTPSNNMHAVSEYDIACYQFTSSH